jgi:hypothetical protein
MNRRTHYCVLNVIVLVRSFVLRSKLNGPQSYVLVFDFNYFQIEHFLRINNSLPLHVAGRKAA